MLGVQGNHRLARFQQIADQQLNEVALALTAIAQNEDVGRGLVAAPTVKVHHDVAAVFVLSNVKAVGICLAGVVEGIEIGHAAGGEYPLKLPAQRITAHRADETSWTAQTPTNCGRRGRRRAICGMWRSVLPE